MKMKPNSILDELVYHQSSGALAYKGVRYMLIRPETIVGFQKTIEESSPRTAGDAIYQGGFRGGYLSAKTYKEIHDFDNRKIIEFMMKMGTEIGWGHFTVDEFDPERRILQVTVENSPFAEAYGESSEGVCHLIRGVISGLATILFDGNCVASEVECLARGDNYCVFKV